MGACVNLPAVRVLVMMYGGLQKVGARKQDHLGAVVPGVLDSGLKHRGVTAFWPLLYTCQPFGAKRLRQGIPELGKGRVPAMAASPMLVSVSTSG